MIDIYENANVPTLTYIAAHMREMDRREIYCQTPTDDPKYVGQMIYYAGGPHRYAAAIDGRPVAAWGAYEIRIGLWTAWAFGSNRMVRCIPRITEHILEAIRPDLLERGAQRVEIRSLQGNALVDRWLASMGCVHEATMPNYGKNGETFNLWAWRRSDFA